ncbi:MAG: hypothetical protein KatS3mg082_1465 [Nitrospiraceae bacterium]|nr:MAG: hypothetical protein KatS3mg082_1465 [Nitrospiraceae bacterium]
MKSKEYYARVIEFLYSRAAIWLVCLGAVWVARGPIEAWLGVRDANERVRLLMESRAQRERALQQARTMMLTAQAEVQRGVAEAPELRVLKAALAANLAKVAIPERTTIKTQSQLLPNGIEELTYEITVRGPVPAVDIARIIAAAQASDISDNQKFGVRVVSVRAQRQGRTSATAATNVDPVEAAVSSKPAVSVSETMRPLDWTIVVVVRGKGG